MRYELKMKSCANSARRSSPPPRKRASPSTIPTVTPSSDGWPGRSRTVVRAAAHREARGPEQLQPAGHRGARVAAAETVTTPARERRLRRESGSVEPAHEIQLVAQGSAELAENADAQLAPDGRDDQLIGQRAIDRQVRRGRVQLVDDPERQQEQPRAHAERDGRRQLDDRLLHGERVRVLDPRLAMKPQPARRPMRQRHHQPLQIPLRIVTIDKHHPVPDRPHMRHPRR
jgi:hypothetical protein